MSTLHEKLKAMRGQEKTAAKKDFLIADDVGLDKLASALETLSGDEKDLDPEVEKALADATAGFTQPKRK